MNSNPWNTVLLILLAIVQIIGTKLSASRGARADRKADELKNVVADSGNRTDGKLEAIHAQGKVIERQTNGALGVSLRTIWVALQRIAVLTNSPEDMQAALMAKQSYDEHMESIKKTAL